MSIQDLIQVVPPPKHPLEKGSQSNWRKIQEDLRIQLPTDLYDFGRRYGTGQFCNRFLRVFNPFSMAYHPIIRACCRDLGPFEGLPPLDLPFAVFPEIPGLFPWGSDDNGNSMFWLTDGPADKWPVILRPRGHEDFERWDMSMTTFLAKALTNEIKCAHMWEEPFSEDERVFEPRIWWKQ